MTSWPFILMLLVTISLLLYSLIILERLLNYKNMKRENLYIKALKIGEKHLESGITYNNMLEVLNEEYKLVVNDKSHVADLEKTFKDWFFHNFYFVLFGSSGPNIENKISPHDYNGYEDTLAFLKGESYIQLLEHQEMMEARQQSQTSTRIAIFAIVISIVLAGISLFNR